MQLNTLFATLLLLLLTGTCFAQAPVKVYRTKTGTIYTAAQKDSLQAVGFTVIPGKKTKTPDTTFVAIELPLLQYDFYGRYYNKPMPAFAATTLDGHVITSDSLKGKVVFLSFWSVTCKPCIMEIPDLNLLKATYPDAVFLAPSPESAATLNRFLTKYPFDFAIIPNAGALFKAWGVYGYPRNLLIDKSGIIREVKEGVPIIRNEKGEDQVNTAQHFSPILKKFLKRKK